MAQRRETDRLWALVDAGMALTGELDLESVLGRIVDVARGVVRARYAALGVLNEDRTGLASFIYRGVSEAEANRIGHLPEGLGLLGALIDDPRPIRLDELSKDSRSVSFPEHHPPMRTFLGVPIVSKGRVFGNLYLTEKDGGDPFSDEDERLAVGLAAQAGVAIENAALYTEVRESEVEARRLLEELRSVQEVGGAVLAELDRDRVLEMIAERAKDLVGGDAATIAMLRVPGELSLEMVVGRGAGSAVGRSLPIEGSLSGRTLQTGEPARVDDIGAEPDAHHPIADALEASSAMFAPLTDRGEAVGVLVVTHRRRAAFDDRDLDVLRSFSNLASLALRNARLMTEEREKREIEAQLAAVRVREEMREDLLRQVIRAQEEERKRIARDLHDSVGQSIASILLGLKVASNEETLAETRARLDDLRRIASDSAGELRRLALELRPTILDDLGLEEAVERYVSDFEARTGVEVALDVDLGGVRVPSEVETVVYRVLQECLTNVSKHAEARNVRVGLRRTDGTLGLRVRDDGVGFDAEDSIGGGLGLRGMEERAALVGGKLAVGSATGEGTTVELEVPVGGVSDAAG